MRFQRCVKHDGRHLDIWGQCVHDGAPCVLRPGVCPERGCVTPIMSRLDLTSGRITLIEEGSDAGHAHQPPLRVEIDEQSLATAIVTASRVTRDERRSSFVRSRTGQVPVSRPSEGTPAEPERSKVGMVPVSVWSPETSDGPGG